MVASPISDGTFDLFLRITFLGEVSITAQIQVIARVHSWLSQSFVFSLAGLLGWRLERRRRPTAMAAQSATTSRPIAEMVTDFTILLVVITAISLFVLAFDLCRGGFRRPKSKSFKDIAQHGNRNFMDGYPSANSCWDSGSIISPALLHGPDR